MCNRKYFKILILVRKQIFLSYFLSYLFGVHVILTETITLNKNYRRRVEHSEEIPSVYNSCVIDVLISFVLDHTVSTQRKIKKEKK